MALRLKHVLDKNSIISISENYGFLDRASVEKFVMDFEVQSRISEKLDCVVRGGMCMPFHADSSARRVSVDVDLLTPATVEQAATAIESMDLSSDGIHLKRHVPERPYPLENLLSYKVYFDSNFGANENVKVDVFCDVWIKLDVVDIRAGYPVIGFQTPRDIKALSRGWLLGDKMSSIALNTVGLKQKVRGGKPKPQTEIVKQVYDMAVLLRGISYTEAVGALDAFKVMTGLKAAKFDVGRYSVSEIAGDMVTSASSLADLRYAVTLTSKQQSLYRNFSSSYLSKNSKYRKTRHVTDVLMVCALAKAARDCESGSISRDDAAMWVYRAVSDAIKVEGGQKGSVKIVGGPHAKVLRSALPEHAVLVRACGELFGE